MPRPDRDSRFDRDFGGDGLSGGGQDSGSKFGNKGMGSYGLGVATGITRSKMDRQRGVTADRSGGPGSEDRPEKQPQTLPSIAAAAAAPTLEALREAADIQNYLTDLQRIALGKSDSQAALERFGVAPEQAMFDYRKSFPEFGDSLANLSLAEITKALGNMSRAPEKFAEGGRAGDTFGSRPNQEDTTVSTDLARFTQMLSDLMMLPSGTDDGRGMENRFGGPDKPQARRPVQEATPGGLMPQTGSPFYGGDAEAFRNERELRDDSALNIIPEDFNIGRKTFDDRITQEPLAPPVAPAESSPEFGRSRDLISALTEDQIANRARQIGEEEAIPDSGGPTTTPNDILMPQVLSVAEMQLNEDIAEEIAYYILRSQGLSQQEAKKRIDNMTAEELSQMGFKEGGKIRRPSPGLLQDNPQRTATVEEVIRDKMESRGLTQEEAVKELQAMFRKTYPMSETVPDYSFAGGGSVRGRRDALPMIEGDHVVPAHAVKGNEGGLAALSKKLMGNKNYDGMIRGPGGPREDAIKTRVFAAGGGIAGKMDNLQNPFNSVPARVSDKEYVIPRQAITNLGMMNGAREGDANKAGQDIIYQLVENLKRKA